MASPSFYTQNKPLATPCGDPALRITVSKTAAELLPVHASFARRYRVRPNLIPLIGELGGFAGIGGAR